MIPLILYTLQIIFRNVVTGLAGVPEETIHGILVDNPRRFLAFVPKKST